MTAVEYLKPHALHEMRLRNPLLVTTVRFVPDKALWVTTDATTDEFGTGDSWEEAIDDYVENLHAMASWFATNGMPLGSHMQRRQKAYRRLFLDPR